MENKKKTSANEEFIETEKLVDRSQQKCVDVTKIKKLNKGF